MNEPIEIFVVSFRSTIKDRWTPVWSHKTRLKADQSIKDQIETFSDETYKNYQVTTITYYDN